LQDIILTEVKRGFAAYGLKLGNDSLLPHPHPFVHQSSFFIICRTDGMANGASRYKELKNQIKSFQAKNRPSVIPHKDTSGVEVNLLISYRGGEECRLLGYENPVRT
jgi:hypothetical protein